jgi:hypothetical protein
MNKQLKAVPKFRSEADDENHFPAAAPAFAGFDQNSCQRARRSLPISHQSLVAGEAAWQLNFVMHPETAEKRLHQYS